MLETMLQNFEQYAQQSQEHLTEMLSVIRSGRVPSRKDVSLLDLSVANLRAVYDSIHQAASEQLSADEMPPEDAAAADYVSAVQNSKTLRLKRETDRIRSVFLRFLSVRSKAEVFTNALAPKQQETLALLQTLDHCSEDDLPALHEAVRAQETLLAAVEDPDRDTAEGLALCEPVAECYGRTVYAGVIANKFYIGEQTENPPSAPPAALPVSVTEPEQQAALPEKQQDDEVPAAAAAPADEPQDAAAAADEDDAEQPYIAQLDAEHCFIESDEEIGTLQTDTSPNVSKKISASIFRSELNGLRSRIMKNILTEIVKWNCLTLERLTDQYHISEKEAADDLAFLMKKGYLERFEIAGCGEFYAASVRLQKALGHAEVRKQLDLPQKAIQWGTSIAYTSVNAAARIALAHLHCYSDCCFFSSGVKTVTESVTTMTNAFTVQVADARNRQACDMIAGVFWDSDAECKIFLTHLKNEVSEYPGMRRFILAAWDLQRAEKIAGILLAYLGALMPDCPVYLYVLSEHAFYAYPSLTPADPDGTDTPAKDSSTEPEPASDAETASEEPEETVSGKEAVQTGDIPEEPAQTANIPEEPAQIEDIPEEPVQNEDIPEEPAQIEDIPETPAAAAQKTPRPQISSTPVQPVLPQDTAAEPLRLPEDDDIIRRLIRSSATPSDAELHALICMIMDGKAGTAFTEDSLTAQSLLLAKAAAFSEKNTQCRALYQQLSYATKSPLDEPVYTSINLSRAFEAPKSASLLLPAYLFALLIPGMAYDYSLKAQADLYLREFEQYFPELTDVKPLFAKLKTVTEIIPIGFTRSILLRLGNDAENEAYSRSVRTEARDLLEYFLPRIHINGLPTLYSACFGRDSDLYQCLEYASNNVAEELDVVRLVLDEFCDEAEGTFTVNQDKVDAFLDQQWYEANGHDKSFILDYHLRTQTVNQLRIRIDAVRKWYEYTNLMRNGQYDLVRLKALKKEIVSLAEQAEQALSGKQPQYKGIILRALREMRHYLNESGAPDRALFRELAQTGVISLDQAWLPVLNEDYDAVLYYEPWRTVLRHIVSPIRSLDDARKEILDGRQSDDLFDNLHQLKLIGDLLGEDLDSTEEQIETARKTAEDASRDFDNALELAFTYNRITETDKEKLAAIKRRVAAVMSETAQADFGIWRQFLNALTRWVDTLARKRQTELQAMLDARFAMNDAGSSSILAEAQRLLTEDMNFAVTEEYINRFDNGEMDFSEELQTVLANTDYFEDFISEDVFKPIYDECVRKRNGNFLTVAKDYLTHHFPADWTSRLKEDSLRLGGPEHIWPMRKDSMTCTSVTLLFSWIGLDVRRAEKCGRNEEMFRIEVAPSPRSMADYCHPIAIFGTQARSQMNVIILHGNIPAKQMVDKITGLGLGEMSIVILNYPINVAVRRQIAEEFHKTSGQNPFILIDQVLAIYLALHQQTERMPILLKCTLPFTTYQPFVRDGGSTADEMFFGRSKELADILNPNGACIVYGGRQLGKTALLERAESLFANPDNKKYAVYCNILNCDGEELAVQSIAESIRKRTGLKMNKCSSIAELAEALEQLFNTGKVKNMLLLLDETDRFLASMADRKYEQLQPLIDLKRSSKNSFKFVLAGLHNVCRMKNATRENGIFGQLGTPLCVKPLSPTDALQLLSRPLKYLGFQIDRYPHLETILTNTNYYPGILQFFGYMLVETLSTHYGKYYRAVDGNPPYTLMDDQLGAVMNSTDLNRSIRDKFRWSLELDPRYFMIARCIAVLYYLNEDESSSWLGFSIAQIRSIAADYHISCLADESEDSYYNLLDEMVEMGILSKPDAEKKLYRLRRSSFINIIGSDFDEVDKDIDRNNTEEAV